jgi:hypothetical protein
MTDEELDTAVMLVESIEFILDNDGQFDAEALRDLAIVARRVFDMDYDDDYDGGPDTTNYQETAFREA